MKLAMIFGDKMRDSRERLGFTQVALGARTGLSQPEVSFFESGERLPTVEKLVAIADALKESIDSLLGRAG